jgi:hypothetical protein
LLANLVPARRPAPERSAVSSMVGRRPWLLCLLASGP